MSQKNAISMVITVESKKVILQNITAIRQQLNKALIVNLTSDDRRALPKMGDKTLAFVGKALDYAVRNPTLVPPYLDITEANKDYALATALIEVSHELATLTQALEDAIMVTSSEAYGAALIFHGSVKGATRTNAPGSKAIYEDMATRFPGRPAKKKAVAVVGTT